MIKKPSRLARQRRVNRFLLKKRDVKICPFLKELFYCWGAATREWTKLGYNRKNAIYRAMEEHKLVAIKCVSYDELEQDISAISEALNDYSADCAEREIFTQYYRGVKFILEGTEHYVTRNDEQMSPDFKRPRRTISDMRLRVELHIQNKLKQNVDNLANI